MRYRVEVQSPFTGANMIGSDVVNSPATFDTFAEAAAYMLELCDTDLSFRLIEVPE